MKRLFLVGLALEGGMGLLGVALAFLVGVDVPGLFIGAGGGADVAVAVVSGLLAAVPPLAAFFLALRSAWPPLARIRRTLLESVLPHFVGLGLPRIVLLAAVAGVGEELLFRGFLQSALAGPLGETGAVLLVAVIFGAVHWITPFYALYAGVLGAYLGGVFLVSGGIIAPIICHAVYDAVALGVYVRRASGPAGAGARSGNGVRRGRAVDEHASNGRTGEPGHLSPGVEGGASDVGQNDDVSQ
jgi:hypothetical protein